MSRFGALCSIAPPLSQDNSPPTPRREEGDERRCLQLVVGPLISRLVTPEECDATLGEGTFVLSTLTVALAPQLGILSGECI